jgi:DNA-binding transcriptional LysR family regulator
MQQLNALAYLDVVARVGSIRKASEILAITPTALTRRIAALEQELGIQIFERLPRGVRLNTAGELLIHHVRNQLSDLDRVKSQIADLSGVRRGHVNIACSQTLLPDFLPEQITEYWTSFPDVTFNVEFSDKEATLDSLTDYSADIAIVLGPLQSPKYQVVGFLETGLCAVLAKSHPLAKKKKVSLDDCFKYDLALPPKTYGMIQVMENFLLFKELELEPKLVSDNFEFLRKCVANSTFLSFGFPLEDVAHGHSYEIIYLPLTDPNVPTFSICVVQLKGRTLSVAVAKFAEQIVRALQKFQSR